MTSLAERIEAIEKRHTAIQHEIKNLEDIVKESMSHCLNADYYNHKLQPTMTTILILKRLYGLKDVE